MRPEEVQNTWQEGGHLMREAEERSKAKMSRAHGQQPESQNEPSVRAADDGIIDSEFLRWIRRTFHHPLLAAHTDRTHYRQNSAVQSLRSWYSDYRSS